MLFLAAEAAPFVKVGGLADVAGSLPGALRALGHDVRLAMPGYGALDWTLFEPKLSARFEIPYSWGAQTAEIWETRSGETPVLLVTGPPIPKDGRIYGSGVDEDAPKFIFFSLAALFSCQALGWQPDVVHTNDWHTGAAAWWEGPVAGSAAIVCVTLFVAVLVPSFHGGSPFLLGLLALVLAPPAPCRIGFAIPRSAWGSSPRTCFRRSARPTRARS